MPVKYVFVTGGVVSGLGKGITAASLALVVGGVATILTITITICTKIYT